MLNTLWEMWNSPFGITVAATVAIYFLNIVFNRKPAWAAYKGTVIAAIRYAEKAIDDKTENKSLARLDEALKYVIKVIEEAEGRKVTGPELQEIKEGIQIVHNEIEK